MIIIEQRLAVHVAKQPARKPNARQHGSKPAVGSNGMTDINDILFIEKWDLALMEIKADKDLIKQVDPAELASNRYYYQLYQNQKGEYGKPNGNYMDLINLIEFCKENGLQGLTIPQAAAFGQVDQIERLLTQGNNIDEQDFGETTGLLVASALNDLNLVKYFIDKGAFVSFYNQDNYEAIDLTSSETIFEILSENGGKTKERRNQDFADYCIAREDLNILREVNLSFMKGAETSNLKQMEEALKRSSMNFMTLNFAYPINGWTALHFAVRNNNKEVFDFLVNKGIDTEKKNIDGLTAYELAKKLGYSEFYND